eukprot:TRINITY_DN8582_c0_g1_i4.p1 TRINITY_DN8582_c0_g1~~TRINITY_DN8582_c0_g1_i4.p1  ORF type:complete len:220 (+),score=24.35 TRINITY_DN8582_c0_g1_i4:38-697(+)
MSEKVPRSCIPKWKQRTESTHASHVQEIQARPPSDKCKVLLLGDSMFERWKTTGEQYWVHSQFDQYGIFNAGVGGDMTENVLWRLAPSRTFLPLLHPSFIILLIGTNNIAKDKPDDVAQAVSLITRLIAEQSPSSQIVVAGVLLRNDEDLKIREKVNVLNNLLEQTMNKNGIRYVNFAPCLQDGAGLLKEGIFDDHVHLNAVGYGLWGPALEALICEYK